MKKATTKAGTRSKSSTGHAGSSKASGDRNDEMLDDYSFLDWSKAERGRYAKRYAESSNIVLIAPDVREFFPNAESVNRALRAMAEVIRASSSKTEKRRAG